MNSQKVHYVLPFPVIINLLIDLMGGFQHLNNSRDFPLVEIHKYICGVIDDCLHHTIELKC